MAYNYSAKLGYRLGEDTLYRGELLSCFYMKKYDDEIIARMNELYDEVSQHYKEIIELVKNTNPLSKVRLLDDKSCFMILFSWDYFYENHQLLREINSKSSSIQDKRELLMDRITESQK